MAPVPVILAPLALAPGLPAAVGSAAEAVVASVVAAVAVALVVVAAAAAVEAVAAAVDGAGDPERSLTERFCPSHSVFE